MKLKFERVELEGPILIPSISSFETQYNGRDALVLQTILTEPMSLISAYDIHNDFKLIDAVAEYQKSGGVLFLDSGGYEFSRSKRYFPAGSEGLSGFQDVLWNIDKYYSVVGQVSPDLVASYDEFLDQSDNYDSYNRRLLTF